jgi:hypothetical protein
MPRGVKNAVAAPVFNSGEPAEPSEPLVSVKDAPAPRATRGRPRKPAVPKAARPHDIGITLADALAPDDAPIGGVSLLRCCDSPGLNTGVTMNAEGRVTQTLYCFVCGTKYGEISFTVPA